MNTTTRNSLIVARREYSWRVRSRTFVLSTLLLVALGVAVAAAPIIITLFVKERPTGSGSPRRPVQYAALSRSIWPPS